MKTEEQLDPVLAAQEPNVIQTMMWRVGPKGETLESWPAFWCPVCRHPHALDKRWAWNGSRDKPTFGPASPGAKFSFISYSTIPKGEYFVLKRNEKYLMTPGGKRTMQFHSQKDAQLYADQRKEDNNGQGWGVVPRTRNVEERVVYCHTYVKDGRLQVLPDTPGPLAGKTVDLEVWSWKHYTLTGKRMPSRHDLGCFNDTPGTTLCEVCGGDLPPPALQDGPSGTELLPPSE